MRRPVWSITSFTFAALAAVGCGDEATDNSNNPALIEQGKEAFRNDTFGDESFWTDTLRMHEVISSAVDPMTALTVGLKVDADVLPPGILGMVDLKSPATTVALLKMNAVVGIKGTVVNEGGVDKLTRVGITCALCHSSVDNSVMPGIGKRMDGWANGDLNPGAIIALSPALPAEKKAVYNSWGKGKYDPRFNVDGMSGPVVIPPAYGLRDSPHATYTGDGDIRYWNNYVAVTQMGGQGNFTDERKPEANRAPSAGMPDMVRPKLDALRAYQFSLPVPPPPAGSFDATAAGRGKTVFDRSCATCHRGSARTQQELHMPADTGADPTYASRSASKRYRTTPLRGLWQHPPYFHDGSAATLQAVVDRYNDSLKLNLSATDRTDLIEYLKSI
jgi:mono/diheme cytochrome c family protein